MSPCPALAVATLRALAISESRCPIVTARGSLLGRGGCRVADLYVLGLHHCRLELLRVHKGNDLDFGKVARGSEKKGEALRSHVVRKFVNGQPIKFTA